MPRYEDRYGSSTRLYVGHLSSRTRTRDLEHIFSRYGRVRDVDMKRDYAFVEFSDPRDADDARYSLDGRDVDGRRITVEFARGIPRGPGGVREYVGRGPAPGSGRCFNCGIDGHWARDCKAGDWKNKCYRCGERGHIERNCQNSPKKLSHKRERSYSRSPVRSYSPRRGRSRSRSRSRSFSRSRSYSQSRSPVRRRRDVDRKERRSITPEVERSPSPSKPTKRSPTLDNEIENRSPSMDRDAPEQRGYTPSPKESPTVGRTGNEQEGYSDGIPKGRGRDLVFKDYDEESPNGYAANGGDGGVVVDDDNNGNDDVGYPRSSESP